MRTCLVIILLAGVFAGCNGRISNRIGSDDYELYAAWMKAHFPRNPPSNLYVSSHTVAFDPLSPTGACQGHNKSTVPRALLQQLHELDQAEYRLDIYPPESKLNIPWSYTAVEFGGWCHRNPARFRLSSSHGLRLESQAIHATKALIERR
jgi:hypothetical protein